MVQASSSSVRALKSLEIDDVKINELQGNKISNLTRGKLIISYSPEYDRFVLSLNSFRYALSPFLPTMAYITPKNAYRSYILPNINGYYAVKLKTMQPPAVIQNLETILSNYSQFSYNSGQESELENQAKGQGDYPMSFGSPYDLKTQPQTAVNRNDNFIKAENAITLGGEFLKQKLIKAADYIGKTIQDSKTLNANELNVRTLQELKAGDPPENQVIDFTRSEFEGMIMLSNQIEKEATNRAQSVVDVKPQQGFTQVPQTGWEGLKTTTVASALTVWRGMDEAASILSNAFSRKKAKKTTAQKPTGEDPNQPKPQLVHTEVTQQKNVGMNQPNMYVTQPPNQNVQGYTQMQEEKIGTNLNANDPRANLYPQLESVPRYTPYNNFAPTMGQANLGNQGGMIRQPAKDENTQTDFMDFTQRG